MDFSVMFFSSAEAPRGSRYDLLFDAARFADERGFCGIWIPERHFHPFGGIFPNPALIAAALSQVTTRIQIRAGSLVSPLHHTIRIVEDWAVVDNLSRGRVAVSFGSGWNRDDFVFFPERYAARQEVMYEQIAQVRAAWRDGRLRSSGGPGEAGDLRLFPPPFQESLPVWVTSSGNVRTFASAGEIGANVLTHLIGQDLGELAQKIEVYRQARRSQGLDLQAGTVTLMLHTFVGPDVGAVRRTVREPFRDYLRSALSLETRAVQAGGAISGGHEIPAHDISARDLEDLLDAACERYLRTASLTGTPESCKPLLWELEEAGVDEIACLIDFIADPDLVRGALPWLGELRDSFEGDRRAVAARLGDFSADLEG